MIKYLTEFLHKLRPPKQLLANQFEKTVPIHLTNPQ